jgi:type I site-specific restriction endonuclease
VGVAVREFPTDVGPADYILFVSKQPVGIIEAKKEEEGERLTVVEDQSGITPKVNSNGGRITGHCLLYTRVQV